MVAVPHFPQASLNDILSGSGADLPAGTAIVTPNRRLAAALKRAFDREQAALGRPAWPSADILPFSALVERLYEEALHAGVWPDLPIPLTDFQERALWEEIVGRSGRGSALMSVAAAAGLAGEAWQLLHAWRLRPSLRNHALDEDGMAFRDWARRYEEVTRRARQTDAARLGDLVRGLCGHPAIGRPARIVLYGFDLMVPQQAALLARLRETGCDVVQARAGPERPGGASVRRIPCDDGHDEMRRAAAWARARLEANPAARIGVVVPDLAAYRGALLRAFDAVLVPDARRRLPGAPGPARAFNVSLGDTLDACPLVDAALALLELYGGPMDFERASRMLRSPFLGGAETEMAARARLDARLRGRAGPFVTLADLAVLVRRVGGAPDCPVLVRGLSTLAALHGSRPARAQPPAALARRMGDILRFAGFPGERPLDSREYQVLRKWHELLAELAALGCVVPRIVYGEAVARLRRMAAATVFQPRTPDAPIQVLGGLEAAGMAFDALWVMGLSADAWPPPPAPNPFLPAALQRSAGLPLGSAAASLARARRLTDAWLSGADEVILSHPRRIPGDDARDLAPSPLIAHVAADTVVLPAYASHPALIHAAGRLERIRDEEAPPLEGGAAGTCVDIGGGTAVIRDQAACPFRALARHRLGARALDVPHAGLDAAERGTLVHHVLARVWGELGTRRGLEDLGEADLDRLLGDAAEAALAHLARIRPALGPGACAVRVERHRLVRLVRAWLERERTRSDFSVAAVEARCEVEIGGLRLSARLDRVDELDDGRRIVIDYKSSAPMVQALLGDRPDEPQLPLYLVAAEAAAAAVAFAQIRPGAMRWVALARDADLLPEAPALSGFPREAQEMWNLQVAAWRASLTRLALGFRSGDARVDPKACPRTCRDCDLRLLCRVDERLRDGPSRQEEEEA